MKKRTLKRIVTFTGLFVFILIISMISFKGWLNSLADQSPKKLVTKQQHNFKGNVIIIGAGASGLAAASLLQEHGIDYQIIEATDHYGGRVQKNEGFADFPIDMGAEWIHHKKDILNRLIGKEGDEPEVELIRYNPENIYYWDGENYEKASAILTRFIQNSFEEYKFKNTTWFDFIDKNFAQKVKENIIYNSPVLEIDYSGKKIVVSTKNGQKFTADKVIVTVPIGVLKSNYIKFNPELSKEKIAAFQSVEFLPGIKLFMKFSDKFYADIIECETESGDKTYYDVAFGKDANDNVLGLLSTGSSAEEYYKLGSEQKIVDAVLKELDVIYDRKASDNYTGEYLFKDWGQHPYTLGTWTDGFTNDDYEKWLNSPIQNKVYFAGGTHNRDGQTGTVHGAIMSGYNTVYDLLEEYK